MEIKQRKLKCKLEESILHSGKMLYHNESISPYIYHYRKREFNGTVDNDLVVYEVINK